MPEQPLSIRNRSEVRAERSSRSDEITGSDGQRRSGLWAGKIAACTLDDVNNFKANRAIRKVL